MWFLNVLYFVFFVVSPSVNKQSSWQPVLSSGLRHHTHDKVKNLCWRVSLVGWLPHLVARCPPRLGVRCLPQLVACCFRHPCARCLRCRPACCLLHLVTRCVSRLDAQGLPRLDAHCLPHRIARCLPRLLASFPGHCLGNCCPPCGLNLPTACFKVGCVSWRCVSFIHRVILVTLNLRPKWPMTRK